MGESTIVAPELALSSLVARYILALTSSLCNAPARNVTRTKLLERAHHNIITSVDPSPCNAPQGKSIRPLTLCRACESSEKVLLQHPSWPSSLSLRDASARNVTHSKLLKRVYHITSVDPSPCNALEVQSIPPLTLCRACESSEKRCGEDELHTRARPVDGFIYRTCDGFAVDELRLLF